jgi:hypothetical protein
MDTLNAIASIITILQLSAQVVSYLNDFKYSSKDCAQCAIESSNPHNLLLNLRSRQAEEGAKQSWYTVVDALAVENEPFGQFK